MALFSKTRASLHNSVDSEFDRKVSGIAVPWPTSADLPDNLALMLDKQGSNGHSCETDTPGVLTYHRRRCLNQHQHFRVGI